MSRTLTLSIDSTLAGRIPELCSPPSEEHVSLFRRTGVGVVRGLLNADEIERVRHAFMYALQDGPIDGLCESSVSPQDGRDIDPLQRWPRLLHPHRYTDLEAGRLALRYLLDDRIAAVLRAVTGEEPIAAQSMFYYKPPGARGQGLHQDNNPLAVKPGTCMAAWIAVDACDAENGALKVVPGTGPLELLCDVEFEQRADIFFNKGSIKLPENVEPVTAALSPGDVLFFNGQVIHGSFPNRTTDRWRRALIFHYALQSCEQIAEFYHPLLDMQGNIVERGRSTFGGLCGEYHDLPEDHRVSY